MATQSKGKFFRSNEGGQALSIEEILSNALKNVRSKGIDKVEAFDSALKKLNRVKQ